MTAAEPLGEGWIDDLLDALLEHEGCVPWFYCDRRGLVTVGVGNLVKTDDCAARLPMLQPSGGEASDVEKRAAWKLVHGAFRQGMVAGDYRGLTTIRMDRAYARRLCRVRVLCEFVPAAQRIFPGFETWPDDAKIAAVDMLYSGAGGPAEFPKYVAAGQARDFDAMADQCHRAGGSATRNAWTWQLFKRAAKTSPRQGERNGS